MSDIKDNRERLDWFKLETYTNAFKEWVLNLFRKAHARMGHIEEDLAKLKRLSTSDYRLVENSKYGSEVNYSLVETLTGEDHGSISISVESGIFPTWTEDINTGLNLLN